MKKTKKLFRGRYRKIMADNLSKMSKQGITLLLEVVTGDLLSIRITETKMRKKKFQFADLTKNRFSF